MDLQLMMRTTNSCIYIYCSLTRAIRVYLPARFFCSLPRRPQALGVEQDRQDKMLNERKKSMF